MKEIVLGLVQGLTEFLPVSSSAHLVLVPHFLGWRNPSVTFDVFLHGGTLLAVLIFFRKDLLGIVSGLFEKNHTESDYFRKLFFLLVLGTLPAAVAGIALKEQFESLFENVRTVSLFLMGTGGLLFLGSRLSGKSTLGSLSFRDAFVVGAAQAFAICPGISRSGATIVAGLWCGLSMQEAARFSFLLSIPAILGAVLVKAGDVTAGFFSPSVAAGVAAAFVSGYLAIGFFMKAMDVKRLSYFSLYCFVIGVFSFLIT